MKIVYINGPAGSGKDTVGVELAKILENRLNPNGDYFTVSKRKFATPLKSAVGAFFGFDFNEAKEHFEDREKKDKVSDKFFGHRPRDWLIGFSEMYAKEMGGEEIFGEMLARRLEKQNKPDFVFITDSGFQPEAEAVIKHFGDKAEYYVIRIHRKGFNFDGDSRSYVYLENPNVKELDVDNEEGKLFKTIGTIMDFVS